MSFVGKLLGKVTGAQDAADAASRAGDIQSAAYKEGIAEQRRQFDALQELLKPYIQASQGSLGAQQRLIGLGTPEEQAAEIAKLETSPMMQALTRKGENAILQNASATGGLRGGNVQAALAQFRPQMLAQMIESQYGKYGGLTSLGANAAVGQGTQGMGMASNIGNLLGQIGAAQAGGTLAQGGVAQQGFNTGMKIAGMAAGAGMFGGTPVPLSSLGPSYAPSWLGGF